MIEFRVQEIDELAHLVAADGIAAHPVALLELAHTAHDLGVSQVLIDVLADPAEPEPARLRALGRIASELSALATAGSPAALRAARADDEVATTVVLTGAAC